MSCSTAVHATVTVRGRAGFALALTICAGSAHGALNRDNPSHSPSFGLSTRHAVARSGLDLAAMDPAVRPGDDFDGYANGRWFRQAVIAPRFILAGVFADLAVKAEVAIARAVDRQRAMPASRIARLYDSFLDERRVEQLGLTPLSPELNRIDAAISKADLASVAARLARIGVEGPADILVEEDPGLPGRYAVGIRSLALGLPEPDRYADASADGRRVRTAYVTYLATILRTAGAVDADTRALALLAFETTIARTQPTPTQRRQVDGTINRWTTTDFATRAPGFDWRRFLEGVGIGQGKSAIVGQSEAQAGFASAWEQAPIEVLRDWLKVRLIGRYAEYLPERIYGARTRFQTVIFGKFDSETRRQRAIRSVQSLLGDDLARAYAEEALPSSARAKVEGMVRDLIHAYQVRIGAASWLSDETRRRASMKIANAQVLIGYPDHWRDYAGLQMRATDLAGNVKRGRAWEYNHQLSLIGKPVDRRTWSVSPMDVTGFASSSSVKIGFSAALLQPPLFDPRADAAVNYGAIGQIIGHELSHLLDDRGRNYDETGSLRVWWKPAEIAEFKRRTSMLAAQFSRYEVYPGVFVDGELSLGENVADLSGLAIALDAYHASATRETGTKDGFNGDQRFFLSFAQMSRTKLREQAARANLRSDPHPPARFRIYEVRNLDRWYDTFAIKPKERMYLAPPLRVKIW